jgi:hypothetical protein
MATMQVNGSSVTAVSTVNNGGTLKTNGSVSATLTPVSLVEAKQDVFGSTVVDGVNVEKSVSAGSIPHNHQNPISFFTTNELAGVSNASLNTPASYYAYMRNPAPWEVLRTRRLATAIRQGYYNTFTGVAQSGYPVTEVDLWWDVAQNSGVADTPDLVASPTRSNPGYLYFLDGSPNPVTISYTEKTGN